MGLFDNIGSFFGGTPERMQQVSTLNPAQQKLQKQQLRAAQQQGAGGAYGDVADYYRSNLSNDPLDFQAFAAPQMRQFNEEIIPGLSEQFAGMGSGGLSSSGFRNAAVNAGTDLSERLGAIRASLRQQSAQGLFNVGQSAMTPTTENIMRPGTEGFLSQAAPAIGTAIGSFAGPIGAAVGGMAGNWLSSSSKGKSSPYGQSQQKSGGMFGQLPSFGGF